jgi:CheY-like chemotaxis protein
MADLLIVDDDRDVSELLADCLCDQGYEVRLAHDGQEGLDRVAEWVPDLVLLDVEMPVLTGPEMALMMFLRDRGQEKIPIVLMSGVLHLERVAAGVGTSYFLTKPYSLRDVCDLIGRALVERAAPTPPPLFDGHPSP